MSITAVARIMYPHDALPDEVHTCVARMIALAKDEVVNEIGCAHDVPNLLVSDGSVITTGAAAKAVLAIVALVLRQADHIQQQMKAGAL